VIIRHRVRRPTVTRNHKELVIPVDIVNLDVGKGSDYLLLGREIGALFELEVTYRTRQGEVTVDTAKVDEATCGLNTRLLGCILLVVVQPMEARD
jgi:hypothetical protein